MELGVPREVVPGEHRVALVPDSVARLVAGGHHVLVESGAGIPSFIDDSAYAAAGAEVVTRPEALYGNADIVLKVRAPLRDAASIRDEIALLRDGTILVGLLQPLMDPMAMHLLAQRGITAFSLDAVPRITRAQGMDVLSSMSTVAGYKATLLAATHLAKFFPLLMTAAGTVTPARVLILGAGVAGLQAIATSRRLGAVVQAFDTRPAVGEQVQSLGAQFLTLPLQAENAEDAGGYARRMAEDILAQERALLKKPVQDADVVITTAMVPGASAPVLITEEMVMSMRPGAVIVDLAAEAGGNCQLTVPGQTVLVHGVTIDGPLNLAATMPIHASQLFSRNLLAFVTHLLDKGVTSDGVGGRLTPSLEDQIVRETCITHAGNILHAATRERYTALLAGQHEETTL